MIPPEIAEPGRTGNKHSVHSPSRFYVASTTKSKRSRRTKSEITKIRDPSGVDAARDIESKLRRYAPEAEIYFERPAVTRTQVEEWNLPMRPTKQTDTRAKKFGSATSVELDAIPAHQLRELVREVIERHVDHERLALLRVAEQSERELLVKWAATYGGGKS
jgi:hypothetical protein